MLSSVDAHLKMYYDRTPITLLLLLFEKKLTNKINCHKINNKKDEFHKFNYLILSSVCA